MKRMSDADVLLFLNFVATSPELRVKHGQHLINGTKHIANKAIAKYKSYPNFNDLLQTSREILWKALMSYDPSKGTTFSSWSYFWIRKQVSIEAMKNKVDRGILQALPEDEEELACLGQEIESCLSYLERKDIMRQLEAFLKTLSSRELVVLEECLLKNKSYRETAEILKISHEAVRKIKDSLFIKVTKEGKKIIAC